MRPHAGNSGPRAGLAMTEVVMVVGVVLALVLGSLMLFNPGEQDEGSYVPPWRQTNASYAYHALEEFRSHLLAYYDSYAALPGDIRDAGYTNSTNSTIGNGNGRIERGNEENLKVFRDLHVEGFIPDGEYRVRGRKLDCYWMKVHWDDGTADEGHYIRLDGFNRLEAQFMDGRYDDGDKAAGDIFYFPYEQDDDFVTLIVKFPLYH